MAVAPQLIAAYFTLAGDILPLAASMASPRTLPDRAQAAARAGYAGIGLHSDDLVVAIERHGYGGIKHILDDCGLKYLEIEALMDWFVDGDRRRASDAARKIMLDAAKQLGAFQLKVTGDFFGGDWTIARMAAEFAALCRQAADVGANVVIEVLPFSNIRDLPTAVEIVGTAAAANGGLLLDVWHLSRGGIPFDDIASIPTKYIKHIEIDDADEIAVGTLLEDTVRNRRLPGEGSLDVPHFLRCVKAAGYQGLYGVEVISDAQRALTLDQAAQRSYQATMAQFERSGITQ
jgi:sugar phosphate isomerase/epimerase